VVRLKPMTTVVHSPDDGGYYLEQCQDVGGKWRFRVSRRIWKTEREARDAVGSAKVKWEKWS
jgi:hypothetical protein